jgi:hypothetical protein
MMATLANELNESFIEDIFEDMTEENLNLGTEYTSWDASKLSLNGAQFFCQMIHINERFYIWVYYYGSKEAAKNYNCVIKAYSGDNEEFSYIGAPRSLDESEDDIINGEHGLMLGCGQAKRIVLEEKMNYSVKISCPKEEAKEEDVESGISDNENTTSSNST